MNLVQCLSFLFQLNFSTFGKVRIAFNCGCSTQGLRKIDKLGGSYIRVLRY